MQREHSSLPVRRRFRLIEFIKREIGVREHFGHHQNLNRVHREGGAEPQPLPFFA